MESVLKQTFTNSFCVWYLLLLICLHISTEASITNRKADVLTESSEFALENSADNINSMKDKYFWWFGPRLGRRKSTHDDDYWMSDGNTEGDFVREFNRESQEELVPLKVRNHNTISFTPRLGRAAEEEIEHLYYQQAATRFGRQQKYLPFSPRLGRELPFDQNCLFTSNLPTCRH